MSDTLIKDDAKQKVLEEVKSLIVGGAIHLRLKNYCKENGYTIRPFVEKVLAEALEQRESRK